MRLALALGGCYLLGSLPTAYVLVRLVRGVDIRSIGSGNVGATNALRTAGPWAGALVLVIDVLKGVAATTIIPRWLLTDPSPTLTLGCGVAAVLGHVFPCWLRFRGGKGVATMLGALAGHAPGVAVCVIGVWLVVFAVSRYVSLGSMAAAVTIPFSQLAFGGSGGEVALGAALAGLILFRHRDNAQRLYRGAEHRAWSRKER